MSSKLDHDRVVADATAIWRAGVDAVDARRAVESQVQLTDDWLRVSDVTLELDQIERVIVVGAGKASGWMAAGFEDSVGAAFADERVTGWVNVPDDQEITLRSIRVVGCRPPGENLPGERVLVGTEKILEYVRAAGPRDVVIFLIAGGGSALLEQPVAPVTLEDFRAVTTMLSAGGADIGQLNTVRRAISQVKAGGLARQCGAGQLVSLIVSDVIGDPLEVIASGPTVLEDSLKQNPQDVIRKFDPDLKFTPASVLTVLGQVGRPDVASSALNNPVVHNRILCNNQTAVAAAAAKAAELGYECELAQTCDGSTDATQLGQELADQLVELTASSGQRCIISGGEPTVTLPPNPGAGGRNQHLVLAALQRLSGVPMGDATFCLLSGGTDGEDGNVPVAGAWLDSGIASAEILDEVSSALNECDSYRVFRRLGRLLRVPPTRTNVCDLRVLVSEC